MADTHARATNRFTGAGAKAWGERALAALSCRYPAMRVVVPLFLLSRGWLIAATLVGARLRLPSVLSQPVAVPLWHTWERWDAQIYALIATNGYQIADIHTTPAFFPLYPLAEHVLAPLVGGAGGLAGLVIANGAWLVTLLELHALARADFGVRAAFGAVLALTVFPTAIFGFVPYPESLFLALAVAALRQMRARRWLPAALLGLLAALTRQAGVFLILPYLWEVFTTYASTTDPALPGSSTLPRPSRVISRSIAPSTSCASWVACVSRPLLLSLLIPLGTALYALWLWHAVGDPLAFWHAEATWHRATAWPWQTLWLGLRALRSQPSRYFALRAAQELLTVLGMGALCVAGLRRAPRSYLAYAIPLYLAFLAQYTPAWPLLSQSRFMLELVPLFIVLGDLVSRRRWRMGLLVALCLPLQLAFIIIFARAGWII